MNGIIVSNVCSINAKLPDAIKNITIENIWSPSSLVLYFILKLNKSVLTKNNIDNIIMFIGKFSQK